MKTVTGPVDLLLDRLEARADDIADRMMAAFVEQIPVYRALPPEILADVRRIVRDNVVEWFRVVRERRAPHPGELEGFTSSARVRAQEQIPLEALLHAYRLGATVAWEVSLEEARASSTDLSAAVEIAGALMRYLDHVSTAVAQAYLEEREHMVTDEERRQREMVELLLSEGCSVREVREAAVRAGHDLARAYLVVCVRAGGKARLQRRIAAAIRASAPQALAVPREDEVLALWPADIDGSIRDLEAAHARLVAEHGELVAAAAGPESGPLNDAYAEARAVAAIAGPGLVARLEDLPLDALIHQAGGRVPEVVAGKVAPLLQRDRHGVLISTLETFISCDGSLRDAARVLRAHRNTVAYRLRRIASVTGLDPRRLPDLFLLYAALRLRPPGASGGDVVLAHRAPHEPRPGGASGGGGGRRSPAR